MTTKLVNKVGLEAEFFIRNEKDELLFPEDYGFDTDEYIILGEFRAQPGNNPAETVANFYKEYYTIVEQAKKQKVTIDLNPYRILSKEFHAKILKRMGTKEISISNNIYGTDILEDTDVIIEDGKVTGYYASIGLHIHFSSSMINEEKRIIKDPDTYFPVNIPIGMDAHQNLFNLNLFRKSDLKTPEHEVVISANCNRITKPVIEYFVKALDENCLPYHNPKDIKLKYRQPGFYEVKGDGRFEYRSLAMSYDILQSVYNIASYSFTLLESL